MSMPFNAGQVQDTEFIVGLGIVAHSYYHVPVQKEVRTVLAGMLDETLRTMAGLGQPQEIEYGEAYPSQTHVTCRADDPTVVHVLDLFNAQNILPNANALNHPGDVDFYCARFTDSAGQQCMGVRTATHFKATVGKNLTYLVNNQLCVAPDKIFKLDYEFDFLVYDDHIDILRPVQFMRIAEVEQQLKALVPQHVQEIAVIMPVVDFTSLLPYVEARSRAQKLVSSIRKRSGLSRVTLSHLQNVCRLNKIVVAEVNGKLKVQPGHELHFLELLDGRRYLYPLDEQDPEMLRAMSRKTIQP